MAVGIPSGVGSRAVHLHANTQNAFPPAYRLLLMEALSLEPWKVWNTYFAPSLQLWELPARTRGACSLGLQVGLPGSGRHHIPGRRTSMPRPRAAASLGQPGTKRPGLPAGPMAGVFGDSLGRRHWRCCGPREAKGGSPDPHFPGSCWGARGSLLLSIALAPM